jgi:hypothetical protein
MSELDELEIIATPAPFYVHETFRRICNDGDCDFCMFCSEEYPQEEGGCCPDNLCSYVSQREKVDRKFDASHPPICPACSKLMVADRTITLVDKDVTAFSCNSCHKFERDSRYVIEQERFKRNKALRLANKSAKDGPK